jgi:hypothetical protein
LRGPSLPTPELLTAIETGGGGRLKLMALG